MDRSDRVKPIRRCQSRLSAGRRFRLDGTNRASWQLTLRREPGESRGPETPTGLWPSCCWQYARVRKRRLLPFRRLLHSRLIVVRECRAMRMFDGVLGQLACHDFDRLGELRVFPFADELGIELDFDVRSDAPVFDVPTPVREPDAPARSR